MTILARLIQLFNITGEGNIYHEILDIMLGNLSSLPALTLEEIAELCNTSTTTINRLLKKVGCSSFRLFKHQIEDTLNGFDKYNRFFPYSEYSIANLKQIYSDFFFDRIADLMDRIDTAQLEAITDLIHASKDVHLYCEFADSYAKQQFQIDLTYAGKKISSLQSPAQQMEDIHHLTAKSVVITTNQSVLPHYTAHQKVMKAVSETDASVIVIASTLTPSSSRYADYALYFKGSDTLSDNYLIDMTLNLLDLAYRSKYIDSI